MIWCIQMSQTGASLDDPIIPILTDMERSLTRYLLNNVMHIK
jgi:hypothetical protein